MAGVQHFEGEAEAIQAARDAADAFLKAKTAEAQDKARLAIAEAVSNANAAMVAAKASLAIEAHLAQATKDSVPDPEPEHVHDGTEDHVHA